METRRARCTPSHFAGVGSGRILPHCPPEWRRLEGLQLPLPVEVGVKVVVELSRCEGYAQRAFLAPEAFRMHGEKALMYDANPDDARRDQVLRAAAACPVQAILVDQLDARHAPTEASP